jgi:hypothetical protein
MSLWDKTATLGGGATMLDGIHLTAIANEILMSAKEQYLVRNLATYYNLPGAGIIEKLPYIGASTMVSTAEGVAATHALTDVDADTLTFAKWTIDQPVSLEAVQFGAADPIAAIKQEFAIAYAKHWDAQLHALVNAYSTNDTDLAGGSCLLEDFSTTYATLLALGAPAPYICQLHPEHYTQLLGTGTLTSQAGAGYRQDFIAGPAGMYVGTVGGFETYVDAQCTGTGATAKSACYSALGVACASKPITDAPSDTHSKGEISLGFEWNGEYRSWVVSLTAIKAVALRRAASWTANIHTSTA